MRDEEHDIIKILQESMDRIVMTNEYFDKRSQRRFKLLMIIMITTIVIMVASATVSIFTINIIQDRATCNAIKETTNEPMATPNEMMEMMNVQNSR